MSTKETNVTSKEKNKRLPPRQMVTQEMSKIGVLESNISHISQTLIEIKNDLRDMKTDIRDMRNHFDTKIDHLDSKIDNLDSKIYKFGSKSDSQFKWTVGIMFTLLIAIIGNPFMEKLSSKLIKDEQSIQLNKTEKP